MRDSIRCPECGGHDWLIKDRVEKRGHKKLSKMLDEKNDSIESKLTGRGRNSRQVEEVWQCTSCGTETNIKIYASLDGGSWKGKKVPVGTLIYHKETPR